MWLHRELFADSSSQFKAISTIKNRKSDLAKMFYMDRSNKELLSPFDLNQKVIDQEFSRWFRNNKNELNDKILVISNGR